MSLLNTHPQPDTTPLGMAGTLHTLDPETREKVLAYLTSPTVGHQAMSDWLTTNGYPVSEAAVRRWRRKNGVTIESA